MIVAVIEVGSNKSGKTVIYYFPHNTATTQVTNSSFRFIIASDHREDVTIRCLTMRWEINDAGEKVYTGEDKWTDENVEVKFTKTYAGKTVYYASTGRAWAYPIPLSVAAQSPIPDELLSLGEDMCAWIMIYGGYKRGVQDIPVSYDGYSDYFQIWVN